MNNHYLTTSEASKRLKVHLNTLYRWLHTGVIKGHRPRGTYKWLIPASEINDFLSNNGHEHDTGSSHIDSTINEEVKNSD